MGCPKVRNRHAASRAGGERLPSVDEILESTEWTAQVEAARRRREAVLSERGAEERPLRAKPWESPEYVIYFKSRRSRPPEDCVVEPGPVPQAPLVLTRPVAIPPNPEPPRRSAVAWLTGRVSYYRSDGPKSLMVAASALGLALLMQGMGAPRVLLSDTAPILGRIASEVTGSPRLGEAATAGIAPIARKPIILPVVKLVPDAVVQPQVPWRPSVWGPADVLALKPSVDGPRTPSAGVTPVHVARMPPAAPVVPVRRATEVRVILQVPSGAAAATAKEAAGVLSRAGYVLAATGKVIHSVRVTNVRYYHEDDGPAAESLARALDGDARNFTDFRPRPSKGTLEVWLRGRARPLTPAPSLVDGADLRPGGLLAVLFARAR